MSELNNTDTYRLQERLRLMKALGVSEGEAYDGVVSELKRRKESGIVRTPKQVLQEKAKYEMDNELLIKLAREYNTQKRKQESHKQSEKASMEY